MSPAPLSAAFRQALGEAWAGGAGALLPVGFFAGAAMLVPFGVGHDNEVLARIGPGILWVALALSSLVTMERLFQSDLEDGALDLWLQADAPMAAIAAAKTLAFWLAAGLPLALITPLLGLMLQMPPGDLLPASLAYGVGGIAFFLWGGVGAALTASIRRGGLLIALIALPLYVPTAIFGSLALGGALRSDAGGLPPEALYLLASSLFAAGVAPFAMAAALRLAAD
ncbi:MAG: heme exporter protein CcmB [Pseudomonadota bacterium]